MNIKQLKVLLKESVREVIKEELPVLLLENHIKVNKLLNENIQPININSKPVTNEWRNLVSKTTQNLSDFIKPTSPIQNSKPLPNNIFADLIEDAGKNIKPGEVQSMM